MPSKLLILCLFSGIPFLNGQSESAETGAKSDLAPASNKLELNHLDLNLKPGVTYRPNTHSGASATRRKRDLTQSQDSENKRKLLKAYAEFVEQTNDKITSIIKNLHREDDCEHGENKDGMCGKKPETDSQILQEDDNFILDSILKRTENIYELLLALIPFSYVSMAETTVSSAHVPHPILQANLNDSVNISCDSEGKPLRFCFWERDSKGQTKVIYTVVDDVIENTGNTVVEGIVYKGDGLATGDCGLEVNKFGLDDVGRWKCELVTDSRETLTGVVTLVTSPVTTGIQQTAGPYQVVKGRVNGSVNLSPVVIGGEPLDLCWWERNVNGQRKISIGDGLGAGKCELRLRNLKRDDFGLWAYTFASRNVSMSRGQVDLQDEAEQGVYFASNLESLKYYSLAYGKVSSVRNSSTARGVAFDWQRNKIYWCSMNNIFRCNGIGTELESVWKADYRAYGRFQALAFDWISGNIYVASSMGLIWACDGRQSMHFTCATVFKKAGDVQGLALNPIEGNMYWTEHSDGNQGSIVMSEMDGQTYETILNDRPNPWGIAIDFASRRLYWTDFHTNQIQSSDLRGRDVKLFLQLRGQSAPSGIAILGGRIFWGTWGTQELQSRAKKGDDQLVLSHYTGKGRVYHLAVGPNAGLPTNRANHCEGHKCPKVCVLNADYFSCLE